MNQSLAFQPSTSFPGSGSFPGPGYPQAYTQASQQAHHFQAPPNPYTTAGDTQALPAQAPYIAPQRLTASPQHHVLPNAGTHGQSTNSHTPPTQYPMAAPPVPQTPANQQQQQSAENTNNASIASPKSPQSPGAQSREQQRINLLLNINMTLLEEVNRLQQQGAGGAISLQQQAQLQKAGQSDKMASDEYIQCLRRVQANLAYMMPKAQTGQHESKILPGPAHMTPPRHMPQLLETYEQLKELFPNWRGVEHRMSQSSSSPIPNAQAGGQNGVSGNAGS